MMYWLPDSQALQNPNEWMDARLDVKLKQINDKVDSDLVALLKETKKAQDEKIDKLETTITTQNTQLQEMLSVAAVNKMLASQNAELKKKVEQFEQIFFKRAADDTT